MKKQALRCVALALLLVGFQMAIAAQEAVSKAQEQVARNQETAARHQATAARLAAESASDPASLNLIRDAAARARDASNRAQDAANRAQDAANRDPASSEAQAAALRAQEAANRAHESANATQEIANRMRRTGAAAGEGVVVSARDSASSNPSVITTTANSASNTPDGTASLNTGGISSSSGGTSSGAATGTGGGDANVDASNAPPVMMSDPIAPARPAGSMRQDANTNKRALSTDARDFNEYVINRAEEIAIANLGPKNNTNQSESPSISRNSTSFVEKSSVGDLFNFAFSPAGTTGGSSSDSTTTSVSLTAYAVKAFLSGVDPLDPAFYTANRKWRKVSFTYGHDFPEGEEEHPMERGDIFGIKFLPYDKRDVSHPSNRADIGIVSDALAKRGRAVSNLVTDIQVHIYNTLRARNALPAAVLAITDNNSALEFRDRNNELAKILGKMNYAELVAFIGEEGIKEIDNLIAQRTEFTEFNNTVEGIINKIRRRPQVSMFFLTNQRKQLRPDEYNAGLSLDLGLAERWNLTFNGTFNYTDNKLKGDNRGGKFGTELLIPITAMNRLADRPPATFSFAASGEWKTNIAPMYQGQAKLTIPLPFLQGLEMPISVSFASRTDLINESDVRGRIGFTFDVARLLTGLKSKFLSNTLIPVP